MTAMMSHDPLTVHETEDSDVQVLESPAACLRVRVLQELAMCVLHRDWERLGHGTIAQLIQTIVFD
jgi:hypothetical protein